MKGHTYACPGCGWLLLYRGQGRYTCTNPGCAVKRAAVTPGGRVTVKEAA